MISERLHVGHDIGQVHHDVLGKLLLSVQVFIVVLLKPLAKGLQFREKLTGSIDTPLLKKTAQNGWRMVVNEDGQAARTTYRVVDQADGLCFIEAKPTTGRTHQIRVHLASIGAPILGDPHYGDLSDNGRSFPMMLHARRIIIPISKNKEPVVVEAPAPDEMATILQRFDTY